MSDKEKILKFLEENKITNVKETKKENFIVVSASYNKKNFEYTFTGSTEKLKEALYIGKNDNFYPLYTRPPQTVMKAQIVTLKWISGHLNELVE